MSLYVYCLGDGLSADSFGDLRGVGGAPVRVLATGGLAAVVSEFEGEAAEVSAGNVRAHNRVNARVLARVTPLPFRFGTLAGAAALSEYVAANEGALLDALARVRGCVEMSVKVRWDASEKAEGGRQRAEEESEEAVRGFDAAATPGSAACNAGADDASAGPAHGAEVHTAGGGSGTAFLLAKRREILGDEALRRRAEEVAAWLASRVSEFVRESSVRVGPSESLVVRAAHLVGRAGLDDYRARVRGLTGERADLHFLASGPWPPYSFSSIERQ
jgi:hypothetical protein